LANQDIWQYGPVVLTALAFWNFFSTCTLQGCQSLFHGESYIRQYPTPLAIFPLRVTLGTAIHFSIALAVCIGLAVSVHLAGKFVDGEGQPLPYHWISWLSLIPTLAILVLFCLSVAVLTGFGNVHFPDMQHLCEVGLQILFYGSPILYRPDGPPVRDSTFAWVFDY